MNERELINYEYRGQLRSGKSPRNAMIEAIERIAATEIIDRYRATYWLSRLDRETRT